MILAPCRYRTAIEDKDGEKQVLESVRGFRVVHVFDISQTEGEEIEDLDAARPALLSGDSSLGLWEALVGHARAAGLEVARAQRASENSYRDFSARQIRVRPDVEHDRR